MPSATVKSDMYLKIPYSYAIPVFSDLFKNIRSFQDKTGKTYYLRLPATWLYCINTKAAEYTNVRY